MRPFSKLMLSLGVFLVVCGAVAWAATGFESRAITALAAGGGGGIIVIMLGLLANARSRGALMAGIHLGLLFPLLLTAAFGWRAAAGWRNMAEGEGNPFLASLLSAMALACLIAFFLLLRMRPPPEERR